MRRFTVQSATLIVVSTMAGCTLLVPGSNHTRDDAGTDSGVALDASGDARGDAFSIDAPLPDAGVDAFVTVDAGTDAPLIDAYTPFDVPMPDAFVEPPDAFVVPDAYARPDAPDAFVPRDTGTDAPRDVGPPDAYVCDPSCPWGCAGTAAICVRPVEVAAGAYHSCVRTEDGEVWCWGLNTSLQCGSTVGVPTPPDVQRPRRQTMVPNPGAVAICAGDYYSCMARGAAGLDCFGVMFGTPYAPFHLPGNITDISCGSRHLCYLTAAGEVSCLGFNSFNGTANGLVGRDVSEGGGLFMEPRMVIAGGANQVAVGGTFSCARVGGTIQCWGQNDVGSFGNGEFSGVSHMPVTALGSGYTDLALTQFSACALSAAGLSCWGYGDEGNVAGQPRSANYHTPVVFPGSFTRLTQGITSRVVALEGTNAWSWGVDQTGVMAPATRTASSGIGYRSSTPQEMFPRRDGTGPIRLAILELSHSVANDGVHGIGGHACAIENITRRVYCWGSNTRSQSSGAPVAYYQDAVEVTP